MTSFAAFVPLQPGQSDRNGARLSLAAAWLFALALIMVQVAPLAIATLRHGVVFDNDDAMRLVQLREWMGGQGWTDLIQHRINPPDSPVSHWSRIVELPLASMISLFRIFAEPLTAERIAIALWPCLLLAGFVLGLLAIAKRLFALPTVIASALIIAINPLLLFQFLPGRIDHHGAQMVLALALAALAGRALFRRSSAAAIAAGVVGALMLAIGLETLPLVGAVATAFGTAWIVEGELARRQVASFGMAIAFATLTAFALTVSPERWLLATVDSLSLPWLWLAFGGGAVLTVLTQLPLRGNWRRRALCALPGAAAVCAIFAILWPMCLAGPYASVDPMVRELWLAGVGEAQPLPLLVVRNPTQFLFFLAFPLVGWLGLGMAAISDWRREPLFTLFFGMATVALLVTLDQMRGTPFASMFGLFGWLYLIERGMKSLREHPAGTSATVMRVIVVGAMFAAALPFGWNALAAALSSTDSPERPGCSDPADMTALAAEPRGLVLAPLRLGSRILVSTPHDILGAPYHRNNRGNHIALAALSGTPPAALDIARANNVDYFALCLGDPDLDRLGSRGGESLVRHLVANDAPNWLRPLPQIGPIRAWKVMDPQ